MPQTPEAQAFIHRITSLPKDPGVSLHEVLQPSIDDEAELRRLWATDKLNARLQNPYVGLVDVFDAPVDIRTTRARIVPEKNSNDVSSGDEDSKYVMPLADAERRKEGEPCMVTDLEEFKKNWSVFSEGSLSQLMDWNNVIAAGGSVLACLTPLPDEAKVSKRAMRKYYHSTAYPTSDVDLFLYGMNPEEAEKKIVTIYEAVRDSVPWDVTCVRTKHTVSIYSQYPYRSVQIVLRLYSSPAEILAGFDIDAPCLMFDGSRVLANPRAIVALMRQCNTTDMTRRSPSYEVRLAKYAARGFEVYVSTLDRTKVDPTIYERSINRIYGLARLLVLEKLKDGDSRVRFLEARRNLRGRPNASSRYYRRKKKYKGDLKGDMDIGGLEMNDYDVVSLHIPYGPGWDARRIEKLVYQTDLGINSIFNPKNKGRRLHRHPAFFGTVQECMDDCCEHCPQPIDADERKLQEEEDKQYIRGRISFVEEDPGRQSMSGSFNPIDDQEWSEQVYVGPTPQFFSEIVSGNRDAVKAMIQADLEARAALQAANPDPEAEVKDENAPADIVNKRDIVGRMPLHVAVLSKQQVIACDLIDAGARISSRLADGRTALHLAAELGLGDVIKKLLAKSKANEEERDGKLGGRQDEDVIMKDVKERPSSEDDWTSDDNGVVSFDEDEEMKDADEDEAEEEDEDGDDEDEDEKASPKKKAAEPPETPAPESGALPEDEEGEPDILDINAPDWDFYLLIAAGADCNLVTTGQTGPAAAPLTLTSYRADRDGNEDTAVEIAKRLVEAGAISSAANDSVQTIFHTLILAGKTRLVETLLKADPKAAAVINLPTINYSLHVFPIVSALSNSDYEMVALLLAYGAKLVFDPEDIAKALDIAKQQQRHYYSQDSDPLTQAVTPVEVALATHTELVQLVVSLGGTINRGTLSSLGRYVSPQNRRSLLDWCQYGIAVINKQLREEEEKLKEKDEDHLEDTSLLGWKAAAAKMQRAWTHETRIQDEKATRSAEKAGRRPTEETACSKRILRRCREVAGLQGEHKSTASLIEVNASGYPSMSTTSTSTIKTKYYQLSSNYSRSAVHMHLNDKYDELYEAAYTGNNEVVQRLCLPTEGMATESPPLQITVQLAHPTNEYVNTGITPLAAAIEGRRWKTAQLIFSIAAAQYKPEDNGEKFKINDISFDDDDDDNGSVGSDDSDDTVEGRQQISFVDVANRRSAVQCNVAPELLLKSSIAWIDKKGFKCQDNFLPKAVKSGDFEAFVNIANIYKLADPPLKIDENNLLDAILSSNNVEMLDEYIRRTGKEISVKLPSVDEAGETAHAVTDSTKLYLGLNVHGKKRKDLATRNDPNAVGSLEESRTPLLWNAINHGALDIIDYLGTSRPYEAYKYFAMCNSDELAITLRRRTDLEKLLPGLLGWSINAVGESPLSTAIMAGDLPTVKRLYGKEPKLMASAMKQRIKFVRYDPLLLAAACAQTDKDMIDFILANGGSPLETEPEDGFNIYHLLAIHSNIDVMRHLLQKFPRELSETLLVQQTRKKTRTPLHIAVRKHCKPMLTLLLDFIKFDPELERRILMTRDAIGDLPLHSAVICGFAVITQLLIDRSPVEALHAENGVGNTPLEIVLLKDNDHKKTRIMPTSNVSTCHDYHFSPDPEPDRFRLDHLEKKVPGLRKTIAVLKEDGKLSDSNMAEELAKFARHMETKLTATKAEAEKSSKEKTDEKEEDKFDHKDWDGTLKAVREAVTARPAPEVWFTSPTSKNLSEGTWRQRRRPLPTASTTAEGNRKMKTVWKPKKKRKIS
ncbi:hypothetical protein D9758_002726 [Tetrapyrgos nigripes]|uniref:Ankyrin repeat protein n=1 Tax=Tetrapyrgos nigripes TaxID=182062 RepID=A0A8H5GQS1_9AGAR|nr:hypothetical protein D9758_002726 [Tetrapyrgos nigripes]